MWYIMSPGDPLTATWLEHSHGDFDTFGEAREKASNLADSFGREFVIYKIVKVYSTTERRDD